MGQFVIVGATGVMGSAAIEAIRSHFGADAHIVANWYAKEDTGIQIDGADQTLFGDINDPACQDAIRSATDGKMDWLCYATALGDVGFPIKDTTPEQIARSNNLSFDPMIRMEKDFDIKNIIGYSTFYLTKHQLGSYGAMGYSKEAIEKWTIEAGKSRHTCIRAGLFESPSSRGIKLLLRKTAKNLDNLTDPLVRSYFENTTTKEGVEKYLEGIMAEERELFGDSPTQQENLVEAHLELFRHENPVFINVCGSKIWHTDEPQLLAGRI